MRMNESKTQQDEANSSETTSGFAGSDPEAPLAELRAKHEGPVKRYADSDKSTSRLCEAVLSATERENQADGVTDQ